MPEEANPGNCSNAGPEKQQHKLTINEKNLVVSFIQYLRQKVSLNECTADQVEGLEVAVQCLETAFEVSDKNYAFQPSKPLLEIFTSAEGLDETEDELPAPTQAEIDMANKLKEEGNRLVKSGNLDEGILKYNEAIQLNRDPIYFCNRAAAYCILKQYDLAIQDCRTALALKPNYAKAYGRMGVALSCQQRYDQAIEVYKKALEIEPNNESYRANLATVEEELREAEAALGAGAGNGANGAGGLPPGFPAGLGGAAGAFNVGNLLNNPQMMQMATQMISDPSVQNLMSQMMNSFMGAGPTAAPGAPPGAAPANPNLESFLRAGETMAQRMEATNPDLVEQLRRTFGGGTGAGSNPEGGNSDGSNHPPQPPPPQ